MPAKKDVKSVATEILFRTRSADMCLVYRDAFREGLTVTTVTEAYGGDKNVESF